MGENLNLTDCIMYLDGKCLGNATIGEFKISEHQEVEPVKLSGEFSGTIKLKNVKFSKAFKDMLKKQRNILKAKQLNVIVKRTRKPRIKKKLVKRIVELI